MIEEERDQVSPFMDVLFQWPPYFSVLKPTHTDKYLDYHLHHLLAHKVSVIRSLHSRAAGLSTTFLLRRNEEKQVMEVLLENG